MCDDWDDNAAAEAPKRSYENQQIYSQNFGNSNYGSSRGHNSHNRNNDRNPRFSRNDGENSYNRSGGLHRNNRSADETSQSETINVPSKYIGRVIGRGGSKINELQAESGARIQVTKEIIGDDTVVKIFGNQDTIDKAKLLINSVTTDYF